VWSIALKEDCSLLTPATLAKLPLDDATSVAQLCSSLLLQHGHYLDQATSRAVSRLLLAVLLHYAAPVRRAGIKAVSQCLAEKPNLAGWSSVYHTVYLQHMYMQCSRTVMTNTPNPCCTPYLGSARCMRRLCRCVSCLLFAVPRFQMACNSKRKRYLPAPNSVVDHSGLLGWMTMSVPGVAFADGFVAALQHWQKNSSSLPVAADPASAADDQAGPTPIALSLRYAAAAMAVIPTSPGSISSPLLARIMLAAHHPVICNVRRQPQAAWNSVKRKMHKLGELFDGKPGLHTLTNSLCEWVMRLTHSGLENSIFTCACLISLFALHCDPITPILHQPLRLLHTSQADHD